MIQPFPPRFMTIQFIKLVNYDFMNLINYMFNVRQQVRISANWARLNYTVWGKG